MAATWSSRHVEFSAFFIIKSRKWISKYEHSKKLKSKFNFGPLELPDGSFTSDNQERAEILNSYFASVFELEGSEALPDFEERNFTEPLTSIVINAPGISKAIDKLKASKLQGPDQIQNL